MRAELACLRPGDRNAPAQRHHAREVQAGLGQTRVRLMPCFDMDGGDFDATGSSSVNAEGPDGALSIGAAMFTSAAQQNRVLTTE